MAKSREAPERIADETTLPQFRYFAAAAETRQFSKAATPRTSFRLPVARETLASG